uniref:PSMD12/CSN4-like N-terminal domain-containing protein n=1 Tax=Aegilops tauschii subsp. strangulata TaxID=200361 RepID=A0A453N3V9_AEGTS
VLKNVQRMHASCLSSCERNHQVVVVREKFPELYESEQQWLRAAQMLSGIDLDSGIRMLDDTNKLSKCVQIARLYLEYDDAVNAEAFINKDSFLVTNSNQEVLNLQYKVCYVRILDLKRKFLEAALRYYGISQILSNAKLGTIYSQKS